MEPMIRITALLKEYHQSIDTVWECCIFDSFYRYLLKHCPNAIAYDLNEVLLRWSRTIHLYFDRHRNCGMTGEIGLVGIFCRKLAELCKLKYQQAQKKERDLYYKSGNPNDIAGQFGPLPSDPSELFARLLSAERYNKWVEFFGFFSDYFSYINHQRLGNHRDKKRFERQFWVKQLITYGGRNCEYCGRRMSYNRKESKAKKSTVCGECRSAGLRPNEAF